MLLVTFRDRRRHDLEHRDLRDGPHPVLLVAVFDGPLLSRTGHDGWYGKAGAGGQARRLPHGD